MIAFSGHVFQCIYICFSAYKLGFPHGYRKIIGANEPYSGVWGGILLIAIGLDTMSVSI